MSSTPDGRFLLFAGESKRTGIDLWLLPLSGGTRAIPLLQQDFDQLDGRVSPDGRWLAYVSNESGTNEVFVRGLTKDSATGALVPGLGNSSRAAVVCHRGGEKTDGNCSINPGAEP